MSALGAIKAKALRCAIYTRKSSEEGLEQSFNSLHAQREAGEAYVLSQAHEGWTALPALYDDGGFSGGSMERPALKRLLADVEAGVVDVVVVYKVDRLTRALSDFARIIEAFDGKGVSFVSVTQAFNTTSSMGRLTLNVLLSFAQFEREVTGERIRDKIALSKQRGMWMGGSPPLGYDAKDGVLSLNPAEADQVRALFRRYLEIGSVHRLCEVLEREGVRSKAWTTRGGRSRGGEVISRGALYHLLQNRTYLGEVLHRGQGYPGRHPAIVDPALFAEVQAGLLANRRRRSVGTRDEVSPGSPPAPLPLGGKLFDAEGDPMCPTVSYGRGGRRYRYYVSACLQAGVAPADAPSLAPRRLPGPALERYLLDALTRLSGRPTASEVERASILRRVDVRPASVELVLDRQVLFGRQHPELALSALRRRLAEGEEAVGEENDATALRVRLPVRLQFRGGRRGLIRAPVAPHRVDPVLAKALRSAHQHLLDHHASPLIPASEQAGARSFDTAYLRRLTRLAFLAPDLQEALLEGRQPEGLTLATLMQADVPLAWDAQRRWWRTL